jgi:ATP/maltotriose-dependent transcriptional regulator MalT/DNA-binding SARP family transcriptional activator
VHFRTLPSRFVPPLPSRFAINRKRLLSLLTGNLEKKIITINGGAGYGKTTLMTQLFQRISQRKLFFTLEEDDQDPAFFLLSLLRGLQTQFPALNRHTSTILRKSEPSIVFLRRMVKDMLVEILHGMDEELYLFFDAEHEIPEASGTYALLDALIMFSPRDIRFVFASRNPLFLESIPKLRLQRSIYEINQDMLVFSEDDLRALFRKAYRHAADTRAMEMILNCTKGWVAGIQMVMQKGETEKDILRAIGNFGKSDKDLTEYFLYRVLKRESKKIQQFLIQSSMLRELHGEVCSLVLKQGDSQKTLEYLEKNNTFIFPVDRRKGIYRYHPLFQTFLLSHLGNKERKQLHSLAGKYFLNSQEYSQALYHFSEAQDYAGIVDALRDYAPQLWLQGNFIMLKKYLDAIPSPIARKSPEITLCRIKLSRLERKYEEIEQELEFCEKEFAKSRKWEKVFETKVYSLMTKHRKGKTEEALAVARELKKKLTSKISEFPEELKILFLSDLAGIYFEIGDHQKMEAHLKMALEYLRAMNSPKWECTIKGNLAILNAQKGNFEEVYETLIALWERYRFQYAVHVRFICANLIGCELILKRYHEAQIHAEWLLEHAKRSHFDFLISLSQNFLAKVSFHLGNFKKAKKLFESSLRIAETTGSNEALCSVYEVFVEYHLEKKQYEDAKKYLGILKGLNCKNIAEATLHHISGKILWGFKLADASLREYKMTISLARKNKDKFSFALAQWEKALLLFELGKKDDALHAAQKTLGVMANKEYSFIFSFDKRERGFLRHLLSCSQVDSGLLQGLLAATKEGKKLLKRPAPKAPKIKEERRIYGSDLKMSFFGDLRIQANGKRIDIKWHSSKVFSLFAFLAARPGFHSVDVLIENFWPAADLSKSYSSLYSAISYIRRHFAPFVGKIVEHEQKSYRFNSQLAVERDFEEFEQQYRLGKKFENDRKSRQCIDSFEKARALYRGEFLRNLYDPWTQEERAYYQGRFLQILRILGEFYGKSGNYLDAKGCYAEYINQEPYEEEMYTHLFAIFAELKDRKALQDYYRKLIGHLDELSLQPSVHTAKSYHKSLSNL